MSRENRTTKDNVGIVYLFTNKLYERENMYKYGITINPFQRKRVQSNSTPPKYPFYDRIVMFSKSYKEIEKRLTKVFNDKDILLEDKDENLFPGQKGGQEWIQEDLSVIVDIFREMLKEFPDTEMCYKGKRYKYDNDTIRELKLPNCSLEFLGILDGDTIKYKDVEPFQVQDNGIIVGGEVVTLSNYVKMHNKREGSTNEWNGFMYFTYKGYNLYKMWQSLVSSKHIRNI
jgi:hypothetical protein